MHQSTSNTDKISQNNNINAKLEDFDLDVDVKTSDDSLPEEFDELCKIHDEISDFDADDEQTENELSDEDRLIANIRQFNFNVVEKSCKFGAEEDINYDFEEEDDVYRDLLSEPSSIFYYSRNHVLKEQVSICLALDRIMLPHYLLKFAIEPSFYHSVNNDDCELTVVDEICGVVQSKKESTASNLTKYTRPLTIDVTDSLNPELWNLMYISALVDCVYQKCARDYIIHNLTRWIPNEYRIRVSENEVEFGSVDFYNVELMYNTCHCYFFSKFIGIEPNYYWNEDLFVYAVDELFEQFKLPYYTFYINVQFAVTIALYGMWASQMGYPDAMVHVVPRIYFKTRALIHESEKRKKFYCLSYKNGTSV